MKKYLALTTVLILAAALLLGCASYSTPTTTPTTPSSGNAVSISNFSFTPGTLTVAAGTTVTWTNNDSTTHTVTSDTGAFGSGNLTPGSSFSHTFAGPGSYAYHCSIHTSMRGTVTVQ